MTNQSTQIPPAAQPDRPQLTARSRSTATGATRKSATGDSKTSTRKTGTRKTKSSLGWKSTILAAGVGITLFGSTMLTRIERANAAAVAAQDAQATAVIQAVQMLETTQALRASQAAQATANSGTQTRTIVVKVPVSITGGQVAGAPAMSQPSGQSAGQPVAQSGQSFQGAPAASAPAIVMPSMPSKPVFKAPVTVTKGS